MIAVWRWVPWKSSPWWRRLPESSAARTLPLLPELLPWLWAGKLLSGSRSGTDAGRRRAGLRSGNDGDFCRSCRDSGRGHGVDGYSGRRRSGRRVSAGSEPGLHREAGHPGQIPAVHGSFAPSSEEVEEARRLIQAFEDEGKAVVNFEGRMVDAPVVERARRIRQADRGNHTGVGPSGNRAEGRESGNRAKVPDSKGEVSWVAARKGGLLRRLSWLELRSALSGRTCRIRCVGLFRVSSWTGWELL